MANRRPVYPDASGTLTQITSPDLIDSAILPAQSGLPAGGTVGQVLVKNSSTAGDASWAADSLALHLSGTETATGLKTLSGGVIITPGAGTGPPVGTFAAGYVYIDSGGVMYVQTASPSGSVWVTGPANKNLVYSLSGTLTVKTGVIRLYAPTAMTISSVRASLGVASTTSSVIVDVRKNGTTIFPTHPGNRPTIASGAFTATGTPDTTAVAASDYLTVDVIQTDKTAANLTVQVLAQ